MTSCEDIKDKISLLIDNELEENDALNVREHLKDCKQCSVLYEEMKRLCAEMNKVKAVEFPKEVHNSIMSEIKGKNIKENNSFDLRKIKQLIPTAACFLIMCITTVALTYMQNNKVENREKILNSGNEPQAEEDYNITRGSESSSGLYEKKDIDIIIEKKEIKVNSAKTEESLNKLKEICRQYDYEAVADSESYWVSLKVLKDTDYDRLIAEINNSLGDTSVIKEESENKTNEYNKIFEEINSKQDKEELNSLYERAFNLELDLNYYEVKLELKEE